MYKLILILIIILIVILIINNFYNCNETENFFNITENNKIFLDSKMNNLIIPQNNYINSLNFVKYYSFSLTNLLNLFYNPLPKYNWGDFRHLYLKLMIDTMNQILNFINSINTNFIARYMLYKVLEAGGGNCQARLLFALPILVKKMRLL